MSSVNHHPTRRELRQFGLILAGILAVWFGLVLPLIFRFAWPVWPWIAAAVIGLPALVVPAALRYLYIGWMYLAQVLGWLNSRIILAIVFYLLITPISFIMKGLGKDAMNRRLDPNASTYRQPGDASRDDHMNHPY